MKFDKTNGILSANASVFIIPNAAGVMSEFIGDSFKKRLTDFINETVKLNWLRAYEPETDKIAEFWWHSKDDLKSENLRRHGFTVTDDDGVEWSGCIPVETLPTYFFEGHKEKDVINVKYPIKLGSGPNDNRTIIDVVLDLNLELNQLDYRYYDHGPFEECLAAVQA